MATPNLKRVGFSSLVWNSKACRYVDTKTSRFLSPERVRQTVDTDIANRAERMQRIAGRVASGEINPAEFGALMKKEVKAVHLTATAAARGGLHNMGSEGFSQAGGLLPFHYRALNKFVADIKNGRYGEPPDLDAIKDRTAMYSEAGRASFEHVRLGQEQAAGFLSEENVLEPDAHHCTGPDSCPAQTAKGRVPVGTLLIPGNRACVTRCKCQIRRYKAAAATKSWDEALHPRDEAGKFSHGGQSFESTKAAEEYANKHLIMNPERQPCDFSSVTPGVASATVFRIEAIQQAGFLSMNNPIGSIKPDDDKTNKVASWASAQGYSLRFGMLRNRGQVEASWDKWAAKGDNFHAWSILPQEKALDVLLDHEIGHMVHTRVKDLSLYSNEHQDACKKLLTDWGKVAKAHSDKLPSTYARIGDSPTDKPPAPEAFAECFAVYMTDKSKLSPEFVAVLDRYQAVLKGVRD